jgi:hypothetical protein
MKKGEIITRKFSLIIWLTSILILMTASCNKSLPEVNPVDKVIKIKDLNQLGTVEYKVSKIISGTDDLTWYKLGNRKILFSCEAVIKAGIDFSKLRKQDISIDNKFVSLKLPKAEVIYMKIDHNKIKEEYKETGFFRSDFTNKEKDDLLILGEQSINKAIPDMGILASAESNAKMFLNSYLKASGFKDVTVEFY